MIYQNIVDIIINSFFQGVTITGEIQLAVSIVALCASLFVFSLPFIVTWRVVKMFTGGI